MIGKDAPVKPCPLRKFYIFNKILLAMATSYVVDLQNLFTYYYKLYTT